jgi:hypothetical protein
VGRRVRGQRRFECIGLVRLFSPTPALAFNLEFSSGAQEVDDSDAENSANAIGVSLGAAYGIQYQLTHTEQETPATATETDGYLFTSTPCPYASHCPSNPSYYSRLSLSSKRWM